MLNMQCQLECTSESLLSNKGSHMLWFPCHWCNYVSDYGKTPLDCQVTLEGSYIVHYCIMKVLSWVHPQFCMGLPNHFNRPIGTSVLNNLHSQMIFMWL